MDFDNDGIMDFISGSYDPGDLYLFRGLGKGKYAAVQKILDQSGQAIVHHPVEFRKYCAVTDEKERYNEENTNLRVASFGSWPAAVDWDADGDLDLLIGTFSGQLFRRMNQGTRDAPVYANESIQVEADGKPLKVHSHCNPVVADWNEDGLWDLVVSAGDGSVWWHPNLGTPAEPKFGPQQLLVPPAAEQIFLTQNLARGQEPAPGTRSQLCVTDYDLDGRLDLVVGDYSDINWTRELGAQAQAELAELEQREKALIKGFQSIAARIQEARQAQKAASRDNPSPDNPLKALEKEREELSDQYNALEKRMKTYFLESRRASFVWVYLRQTPQPAATPAVKETTQAPPEEDAADVIDRGPVKIRLTARRVEGGSPGEFDLEVELDIAAGWHTYGRVPDGSPYQLTTVTAKLPPGMAAVGKWKLPPATPSFTDPQVGLYTDTVRFSQRVKVSGEPASGKLDIRIDFQACDEEKCLPPTSITRTIALGT